MPRKTAKSRLRRRNGKFVTKRAFNRERMVAPVLLVATVAFSYGLQVGVNRESFPNKVSAYFSEETTSVQTSAGQIAKFHEAEVVVSPTPEPSVEPTPSPTPEPKTEKQEIIEYIVEVFGEDAPDAFNVLFCENRSLKTDAINENRNGTTDHSLFQINSIHTKRFGNDFKTDWRANVDVAHQIFTEQGWSPWACSHRVGVTPFWQK